MGSIRKTTNKTHSISKKEKRNIKERIIRTDFTKIPRIIENPTRPARYSFFIGLKNVLRRREREKSCMKYSLKARQIFKKEKEASLYQKTKNQ